MPIVGVDGLVFEGANLISRERSKNFQSTAKEDQEGRVCMVRSSRRGSNGAEFPSPAFQNLISHTGEMKGVARLV